MIHMKIFSIWATSHFLHKMIKITPIKQYIHLKNGEMLKARAEWQKGAGYCHVCINPLFNILMVQVYHDGV